LQASQGVVVRKFKARHCRRPGRSRSDSAWDTFNITVGMDTGSLAVSKSQHYAAVPLKRSTGTAIVVILPKWSEVYAAISRSRDAYDNSSVS
jgi:hypothetical protein